MSDRTYCPPEKSERKALNWGAGVKRTFLRVCPLGRRKPKLDFNNNTCMILHVVALRILYTRLSMTAFQD